MGNPHAVHAQTRIEDAQVASMPDNRDMWSREALVYATLALAEEQRRANLIALAGTHLVYVASDGPYRNVVEDARAIVATEWASWLA